LADELKELEIEYYELAKSPAISGCEVVDKPKVKTVEKSDFHAFDIRERVNWLEMRLDDLEKTLILLNKNFDDYRRIVNERLKEYKKSVDQRLDSLENHERIPSEVRNELSSLKTLVEKTMNVNEEIREKTPVFMRELEGRVNSVNEELRRIKEETKKDHWTRPVILE